MITLLTGDNSFELTRALNGIVSAFDGLAEKFDGSDLIVGQLPDLLLGATLFADKRLVILANLSENKHLWEVLPEWLERMSDDIHLVLVEQKPDKRTKTYKDLKKNAAVKEFVQWGERDIQQVVAWVIVEAESLGFELDKNSAQLLVSRIGVDQWRLHSALQKLSVLESIDKPALEKYIDATPSENVFNLLDAALRGDTHRVTVMIRSLQAAQDPYMTFGLLTGQVFQLAALATSEGPSSEVASAIGAHPYALSKLSPHAKRLGLSGVRKVAKYFAQADSAMKSSSVDPWILIEEALIKTTSV